MTNDKYYAPSKETMARYWTHWYQRHLQEAALAKQNAIDCGASFQPEERRGEQVAWRAYTETGKEHLIWKAKDSDEEHAWLKKHYARWDALYASPTPQICEQGEQK
jgi:hypothetical protein